MGLAAMLRAEAEEDDLPLPYVTATAAALRVRRSAPRIQPERRMSCVVLRDTRRGPSAACPMRARWCRTPSAESRNAAVSAGMPAVTG